MKDKQLGGRMEWYLITVDFVPPQVSSLNERLCQYILRSV